MPRHARAECNDCGETWTGTLEEVSDRVDDHDQFHDVDIKRAATDGGSAKNLAWLPKFDEGNVVRCMTCGNEADDIDDLTHKSGCPDAAEDDVAPDGGVVQLYYAGGNAGKHRTLHVDDDCRHLDKTDNVNHCSANNAPRGRLCGDCAGDCTLTDLAGERAVADGGHPPGASAGGDHRYDDMDIKIDNDLAAAIEKRRQHVAEIEAELEATKTELDILAKTTGAETEAGAPATRLDQAAKQLEIVLDDGELVGGDRKDLKQALRRVQRVRKTLEGNNASEP